MSMRKFKFILVIFTLLSLVACKGEEKKAAVSDTKVAPQEVPGNIELSALQPDVFKYVYENCDYLDIIFENLPFSMSQDNQNGIKSLMSYIDFQPPVALKDDCTPMGRQIYQIAGEVIMEADMYVSPDCNYYVFFYQGKTYYNAMVPKGVEFFTALKNKKFN
jgi:hypothetical protein